MQTQNLIDQFLKENETKNICSVNSGFIKERINRNRNKNFHGTFQPIDEYRTKKIELNNKLAIKREK